MREEIIKLLELIKEDKYLRYIYLLLKEMVSNQDT